MLLINNITAGTTRVNSAGRWELSVPPLTAGSHLLRVYAISESGEQSLVSEPTEVFVLDIAPLDFAGSGRTSITTWRRAGPNIHFKVRDIDATQWIKSQIPGHHPAPGDYDGDGVADLGAVSITRHALVWNVRSSLTGKLSRAPLGVRGDTILTGCKLHSPAKTSLVTFARKQRTLRSRELDSNDTAVVTLSSIKQGDLMGCGDIDGDGIDEIIFKTPARRHASARVNAFDARGKIKLTKPLSQFIRGYVVRRPGSEAPLVAVLRGATKRGIPIRVETVAGTFAFPLFYVSQGSSIATGLFGTSPTEQHPGIIWLEQRSRRIFHRLFVANSEARFLFRAPHGYRLMRAGGAASTEQPARNDFSAKQR